jgi:hypothetical protein
MGMTDVVLEYQDRYITFIFHIYRGREAIMYVLYYDTSRPDRRMLPNRHSGPTMALQI